MQLDEANRQKKRLQLLSERNAEGVNIEYLKNVVIKYIESSNGIEKERLIPVIATVLQFRYALYTRYQIVRDASTRVSS